MYKTINTHEGLKPIADTFIMENDRNLYRPFFECAEEYASIHRMVLGGTVSVDLLIGAPFTRNSFFWEFYCDNTFLNARGLAEAISLTKSTHIPARTTALVTNIKHREFAISVNARMLFKIYSLDKYRGVNLINIIKPIICGSYFKNIQIQCIPEYMQLINIYRTLYTPGKVALWKSAFDAEKELWARTLQINGGRDNNRGGNKWRDNNRGGNKWRDNNRGNKWRDNNRGNKWEDNGGEARADDGIIIEYDDYEGDKGEGSVYQEWYNRFNNPNWRIEYEALYSREEQDALDDRIYEMERMRRIQILEKNNPDWAKDATESTESADDAADVADVTESMADVTESATESTDTATDTTDDNSLAIYGAFNNSITTDDTVNNAIDNNSLSIDNAIDNNSLAIDNAIDNNSLSIDNAIDNNSLSIDNAIDNKEYDSDDVKSFMPYRDINGRIHEDPGPNDDGHTPRSDDIELFKIFRVDNSIVNVEGGRNNRNRKGDRGNSNSNSNSNSNGNGNGKGNGKGDRGNGKGKGKGKGKGNGKGDRGKNPPNAGQTYHKLRELAKSSDYILIGDHALGLMNLVKNPSRVQVISAIAIETIQKTIANMISVDISMLTVVNYMLNIPSDFQIIKYTIYLVGKEQTAVIDVFNSSVFDMIPWVKIGGYFIGNPWVLLRWLFIDIWVLRLITGIAIDPSPFILEKIRHNYNRAFKLRNLMTDSAILLASFQLTNYAGVYIDEIIAKKQMIKAIGVFYPTYYPALVAEKKIKEPVMDS